MKIKEFLPLKVELLLMMKRLQKSLTTVISHPINIFGMRHPKSVFNASAQSGRSRFCMLETFIKPEKSSHETCCSRTTRIHSYNVEMTSFRCLCDVIMTSCSCWVV